MSNLKLPGLLDKTMLCNHPEWRFRWQKTNTKAGRAIRVTCKICGIFGGWAPQEQQYIDLANADKEYFPKPQLSLFGDSE